MGAKKESLRTIPEFLAWATGAIKKKEECWWRNKMGKVQKSKIVTEPKQIILTCIQTLNSQSKLQKKEQS